MNALELYPARRHELRVPEGFATAASAITVAGDIVRLLISKRLFDAAFATIEQPAWASFPATKVQGDYSAMILISGAMGEREVHLFQLTETFPKIELFPNGDILLVGSRCSRSPDGDSELNASVFASDGKLRRQFLLGDGIQHVQVDSEGNIWVGYSDEGVYGNFGWQYSETGPLGTAGLSCFSPDGHKLWDFQPPPGFDPISDCYALNVCANGTWACYYTEFPIALVDPNRRVRCWRTEISGSKALAVKEDRILLYGGYSGQSTQCNLVALEKDNAKRVTRVSLTLPDGIDLAAAIVKGRGGELHVVTASEWFVFSVPSLSSPK